MTTAPEARVTAVCVVHRLLPDPFGAAPSTAIDKRPVTGAVTVRTLGLTGDVQCDREHHGGRFQAVYAYADEDAQWWAEQVGRAIPVGLFGENLRLTGVDVSGAEVGERWQLGALDTGVQLEVTAPRVPCRTFADRMDEPHWVKRFTAAGRPGAYLRVHQEGTVAAGDPVQVTHRPGHGVTVGQLALGVSPAQAERLLRAGADATVQLDPALVRRLQLAAGRADSASPAVAPSTSD